MPRRTESPTLLADPNLLGEIEENFKGNDGRPLQKLLSADINSRILVEVDQSFPEAVNLTAQAIIQLEELSPWMGIMLKRIVPWIIPIYHEKYGRPFRRGFSQIQYLGTIFTSFVERNQQALEVRRALLTVDLAHELGHQVLMLYQLTDKILATPLDAPVYSSIRRTERPAILSFHACVAAAYMMEVFSAIIRSESATKLEKEFAANSWREVAHQQSMGVEAIKKVVEFTQFGRLIMNDLEFQLSQVRDISMSEASQPNLSYFGLVAP